LLVEGSGKEEHKFVVDFIAKELDSYVEESDIFD
jgi:hypothetical protein